MEKIAFCFLTNGDLGNMAIWQRFFADANGRCAIYIHSSAGLTATALENATLLPTQPTEWGTFSLVEVQQRLCETAFEDETISKFVILSGDSIPLYKFDRVYERLTSDNKGYMRYEKKGSGENSVNRGAWPATMRWSWSLTAQWVTLNREHVALLKTHFPMLRSVFGASTVPDEHVYSILFESLGLLDTFHCAQKVSHMYVYWTVMSTIRLPRLALRGRFQAISTKCRIKHRDRPWTFHAGELNNSRRQEIYNTNCLFMRKICPTMTPCMDWNAERILVG